WRYAYHAWLRVGDPCEVLPQHYAKLWGEAERVDLRIGARRACRSRRPRVPRVPRRPERPEVRQPDLRLRPLARPANAHGASLLLADHVAQGGLSGERQAHHCQDARAHETSPTNHHPPPPRGLVASQVATGTWTPVPALQFILAGV